MAKTFDGTASDRRRMTLNEAYGQLQSCFTRSEDEARRCSDATGAWRAIEILWKGLGKARAVVKLTANVLSAHHTVGASEVDFREFERLLSRDYRDYARRENYPGEADALASLTNIFERMRQLRLAPHLASKHICAVAGGFSSGKSSLLNRLIGDNLLPEGLLATTAIPTYVADSEEDWVTIVAFSNSGGSTEVEPQTLQEMMHGFASRDGLDAGIPWREIVDRVSLRTPKLRTWGRIAFVDTPGHTNSDVGGDQDEQVAMREVLTSRFLIWVIDCEKGTLPAEDVQFVRRFVERRGNGGGNGDRCIEARTEAPIYFVLNKADKKASDLDEIVRKVTERVEKSELPYFGVGLYSALHDDWYGGVGGTFIEFLKMMNDEGVNVSLDRCVSSVFEEYADYHDSEVERFRDILGLLNRLDRQQDAEDGDGRESRLDRDLDRHMVRTRAELEHHRHACAEARHLQGRFVECTQAFMLSLGLEVDARLGEGLSMVESGTGMGVRLHDFGDGKGAVHAHRHRGGGGWVADSASVTDSAYVSRAAVVFGNAEVRDGARITGNGRVSGHAEVCGNAHVFGGAKVCGNARVYGDAEVFENAEVSGEANVSGDAKVCNDAKVRGDAEVYGDAEVSGKAVVSGNATVCDNAKVAGNARVSDNATVCDNAKVAGNARVSDNARASDNAKVAGNARVSDNATVYDNAKVAGNARVSGDASVYDNAMVCERAQVSDNARVYDNAVAGGDATLSDDDVLSGNERRK